MCILCVEHSSPQHRLTTTLDRQSPSFRTTSCSVLLTSCWPSFFFSIRSFFRSFSQSPPLRPISFPPGYQGMVCACTVWNVSPEVEGYRVCLLSVSYASLSPEGFSMALARGWSGGRALTKPLSDSAYSMRRFRERMKQNPQLYRMYRERQSAWNKKYASKFKRGNPNWVGALRQRVFEMTIFVRAALSCWCFERSRAYTGIRAYLGSSVSRASGWQYYLMSICAQLVVAGNKPEDEKEKREEKREEKNNFVVCADNQHLCILMRCRVRLFSWWRSSKTYNSEYVTETMEPNYVCSYNTSVTLK